MRKVDGVTRGSWIRGFAGSSPLHEEIRLIQSPKFIIALPPPTHTVSLSLM